MPILLSDFMRAIQIGNIKEIQVFLNVDNFDPTFNNYEALIESVRYDCFDIFKLLFNDQRFHNCSRLNESFVHCCYYDNQKIAQYLFDSGKLDFTHNEHEAFISACYNQHNEIINMFLKNDMYKKFKGDVYLCEQYSFEENFPILHILARDNEFRKYVLKFLKELDKFGYEEFKLELLSNKISDF